MNGPGIYVIIYQPASWQWKIKKQFNETANRSKLNKVEHILLNENNDYYRVYLDSTGNIPAYLIGANMIMEVMKNETT